MKKFIYLDTNELNYYIAQIYNGLTTSKKKQKEQNKENGREVNTNLGVKTNASGGLKDSFSFQGDIEAGVNTTINDMKAQTIKDIETKVIPAEAFDKFINYIEQKNLKKQKKEESQKTLNTRNRLYYKRQKLDREREKEEGMVEKIGTEMCLKLFLEIFKKILNQNIVNDKMVSNQKIQ